MVASFVDYVLIPLGAFCAGLLTVFVLFTIIRYCSLVVNECREDKRKSSCAFYKCHSCSHYRECNVRSHKQGED